MKAWRWPKRRRLRDEPMGFGRPRTALSFLRAATLWVAALNDVTEHDQFAIEYHLRAPHNELFAVEQWLGVWRMVAYKDGGELVIETLELIIERATGDVYSLRELPEDVADRYLVGNVYGERV